MNWTKRDIEKWLVDVYVTLHGSENDEAMRNEGMNMLNFVIDELKKQNSTAAPEFTSNEQFIKELDDAIDTGRDTDFSFNGESEVLINTYNNSEAMKNIIEVIKKFK